MNELFEPKRKYNAFISLDLHNGLILPKGLLDPVGLLDVKLKSTGHRRRIG